MILIIKNQKKQKIQFTQIKIFYFYYILKKGSPAKHLSVLFVFKKQFDLHF